MLPHRHHPATTDLEHDGRDLDAGNANASMDGARSKAGPAKGRQPIVVGDALDPMQQFLQAKRQQAKGGAGAGEGQGYDFVGSDEEAATSFKQPGAGLARGLRRGLLLRGRRVGGGARRFRRG